MAKFDKAFIEVRYYCPLTAAEAKAFEKTETFKGLVLDGFLRLQPPEEEGKGGHHDTPQN